MSSTLGINENDLDSPGYEYLRCHRNMMNLYYKLLALDYQRDFCPAYKCPPINQCYFSGAHANAFEQQYVFTCLCAWLIKDKCQMNFELDLEDMGASTSVIFEALRLLINDDHHQQQQQQQLDPKLQVRLEQGHGPEVVYALSCFADRALEVALEQDPSLGSPGPTKIYFHNKQQDQSGRPQGANSITIGQPIVGGTLTTRSLGKYAIEDSSLVLDHQDDPDAEGAREKSESEDASSRAAAAADWERQVAGVAAQLRKGALTDPTDTRDIGDLKDLTDLTNSSDKEQEEEEEEEDWQGHLRSVSAHQRALQSFGAQARGVLVALKARCTRQLQVLAGREKFLQAQLAPQLATFLAVWREHALEHEAHERLLALVNERTDSFESYNARLRRLSEDIEARIRELSDGSKLRELEQLTRQLEAQSADLDVKVGLLLAVYGARPV